MNYSRYAGIVLELIERFIGGSNGSIAGFPMGYSTKVSHDQSRTHCGNSGNHPGDEMNPASEALSAVAQYYMRHNTESAARLYMAVCGLWFYFAHLDN